MSDQKNKLPRKSREVERVDTPPPRKSSAPTRYLPTPTPTKQLGSSKTKINNGGEKEVLKQVNRPVAAAQKMKEKTGKENVSNKGSKLNNPPVEKPPPPVVKPPPQPNFSDPTESCVRGMTKKGS